MTQVLALLLALAALRTGQPPAGEPSARPAPPPDRGVVAVLRRDGIMLPFAAFKGTSWSTPWPAGLRYLELPINVEAIPERWWGGDPPAGWTAWLSDGRSAALTLTGVQPLLVQCEQRLGLSTNHRPSEPLPMMPVDPFPKDGLAVTSGVVVDPVEIVGPSADADAFAGALASEFNRAEDLEVSGAAATGWAHPVSRRARHKAPLAVESWYRTRLDAGVTVSYVEVVRKYPPGPGDDGCGLETLFSGWVMEDPGRKRPRLQLGARLTYCDRVGATYMLPLGRLRLRDRIFWISQLAGYSSEWYAVAALERDRVRVVAEYPGGRGLGCR